MPKFHRCLSGLLMISALAVSNAAAATRVELIVDEPFADRAAAWPITTGVPFPRGALASADHCRLVDDTGAEQLLQARAAATWDAEAKSVRWLTIDFLAQPGRKYALEFGDDVRPKTPSPLRITRGASLKVATGPLAVEFRADGKAALGSVAIDLDEDGRIDAQEVVASGAAEGEHYYLDQEGRRFASEIRGMTLESAGPVRACVRVDGVYQGNGSDPIAHFRTRYHLYAGLPLVKVVDELKFVGSTKETRFKDIGYALDLKVATQGRTVTVDASGEAGSQPLAMPWAADTQSIAAYQTTYRHYGNLECVAGVDQTGPQGSRTTAESEQMGEWMQVADGRAAVTGSLRWFWEQFPKEWEATPARLTLHLWSPRGGELDFGAKGIERFFGAAGEKYLRSGQEQRNRNPLERFFYYAEVGAIERGAADGLGINKHHEFFLHFGPAKRSAEGAEYGRLAARQPLALARGAWNCGTDVFGPLAARPNDSKHEGVVDRIFDLKRRMQDEFGDYGWWLFGAGPHYSYNWDQQTERFYADSRRFEFHTYGKETQLWWNYLRSGERKFYDWAIPSENHWADIAVSHVPMTIECAWRGGEPDQRTLHWRPGEWSIDSPTHYVRHHDRAEAWLRGGAQFWASYHRTLETTSLAYYLTGDERYNDVLNFWRDYWANLAGKNSRSTDIRPWHREQAWYKASSASAPAKTWAEMIRDYAPFGSGTRHNLTLFFNLATLYEHTWDPQIGQVLREYADAFLNADHPTGVWRPQDARLPAHAEAPSMGHFWAPALWKYARVTNDPRMPGILARYFDTGYAADPFRDHEHVGVYSNAYLGYAYYFTRDPRHLALAAKELDQLLPFGEPLAKPQDINERLYNPYAPIRSLAGVPRLLWALAEARRANVAIPPPPLRAQRTAIVLHKPAGQELVATLWGYEPQVAIIGPDARPFDRATWKTDKYASEVQPFDRTQPHFEVFLHRVTLPADAAEGAYVLSPELELAILDLSPYRLPLWNAARPIALEAGEMVVLEQDASGFVLRLECAQPASLRVTDEVGNVRTAKITGNIAEFDLREEQICAIGVQGKPASFRIVDRAEELCWVMPVVSTEPEVASPPDRASTQAALRTPPIVNANASYIAGRFGSGVQVVPGRSLHVPDHIVVDGIEKPLFDRRQGTIEFWVRKLWDERLSPTRQANLLTNGLFTVANRPTIPLGEWAHIALVWTPYRGDPERTITYLYINGRDLANYRSFNWDGYSSVRATSGPPAAAWRKELLAQALPGAAFAIDELRISSTARYADPAIEFGPQQTFNPVSFTAPASAFEKEADTSLLLHFDGDLKTVVPEQTLSARLGK